MHYGGGNGYHANVQLRDIGGGGGGSAGPGGGGRSATDRPGGVAVPGGGPGGNGGYSAVGSTPHTGSSPASGPGGGGGGGSDYGGSGNAGAAGAAGKVRLSYGASGLLPLNSLLLHMPGRDAPHALSPLCPVGSGADVPDGREYTIPAVGALNARFAGAHTLYLVAGTWNSPSSSRLLTVTIRQYAYSGATSVTPLVITRTVTPSTDITNGFVDMGPVTLPLAELPPGQLQGYFTVGVISANSSDRFLDVLLLDVAGQTLLINVPGASVLNNIWVDEADQNRALGGVFGSYAERDQAQSITGNIDRWGGGAFSVEPGQHNRLLTYSAQGAPAATGWYIPHWWMDRTDQAVLGL